MNVTEDLGMFLVAHPISVPQACCIIRDAMLALGYQAHIRDTGLLLERVRQDGEKASVHLEAAAAPVRPAESPKRVRANFGETGSTGGCSSKDAMASRATRYNAL